jgi:hypothetical protein
LTPYFVLFVHIRLDDQNITVSLNSKIVKWLALLLKQWMGNYCFFSDSISTTLFSSLCFIIFYISSFVLKISDVWKTTCGKVVETWRSSSVDFSWRKQTLRSKTNTKNCNSHNQSSNWFVHSFTPPTYPLFTLGSTLLSITTIHILTGISSFENILGKKWRRI